jgi:nucleotide-binding universal stress UspA family protein
LHVLPVETATNPDAKKLSDPIYKSMASIFGPKLARLQCNFVIESGEVADTILRVARDMNADMVALGIRNAFLPALHLGARVAYNVMVHAHCPVVTCR